MGSDTRHAVTLAGGDRLWQGARIHRLTLICPRVFPVKLECLRLSSYSAFDYSHNQPPIMIETAIYEVKWKYLIEQKKLPLVEIIHSKLRSPSQIPLTDDSSSGHTLYAVTHSGVLINRISSVWCRAEGAFLL